MLCSRTSASCCQRELWSRLIPIPESVASCDAFDGLCPTLRSPRTFAVASISPALRSARTLISPAQRTSSLSFACRAYAARATSNTRLAPCISERGRQSLMLLTKWRRLLFRSAHRKHRGTHGPPVPKSQSLHSGEYRLIPGPPA